MSAPQWKPSIGDTVWLFDETGTPHSEIWLNDKLDLAAYQFGNVFDSRKACLAAASVVKSALRRFHREAK